MNMFHELYYGNISPWDKKIEDGGEYAKQTEKLLQYANAIMPTLDNESRKLWEEFIAVQAETEALSNERSFADGFCLGAMLMLEIIGHCPTDFTLR